MVTVTISNIQQVAKGGFARVNAAGDWKTGGKGLGGRVVAWFTGIVSRDKVARENRTAIDQFVQAIGSDTRYNDSFSMVAKQKLKHLSDAGKPLRERKITQVLSEIEELRVSHNKMNHATAERFSDTDPDSLHQTFATVLSMVADEHGRGGEVGADLACVKKTADDIRQGILSAGDNGKKIVSAKEAQEIAKQRIHGLVDQLAALDDILVSSDIGYEEEDLLTQKLSDEPDISEEIIFSFIHGGRANQLAYESGELPKMLYQAAETAGISELAGHLTLQSGVDSGMVIRVSARLKTDFPNALATKGEMLSMFRDEVSNYVAGRKKLMEHVDSRGLTGAVRADIRKMIAQDTSIKKTADIDVIIAAAPGYGSFCQSLSMGGTEEMAAAFVRYQDSFNQAMEPLMHSGMTVAETAPRRIQALSLWVAQQNDPGRNAPDQATDIRRNMELAYNNLTGASGDRWVDSTVWVAEQHRRVDSNVDDIARTVQNLRHTMAAEIGDYLGIKPADDPDASPTREGIVGNISGESDVSDNVYCMFRDLGVNIPLPELMGRSKAEAFDTRFSERFLDAINDELQTTRALQDGIDGTMYRDLNRANYFTGEPGTVENLLTSARIGEGKEAALGVFNRLFDDAHDEAGKQAVSKATHQGLFAEIDNAHLHGCGPFSQAVIREQESDKSDISYRIWQEPGGSGYRVQASLDAPVQLIVNPADGSMRHTDMATSKFAFEANFRISRQSIDAGNPRAELLTAPTYEYQINPAQEEG